MYPKRMWFSSVSHAKSGQEPRTPKPQIDRGCIPHVKVIFEEIAFLDQFSPVLSHPGFVGLEILSLFKGRIQEFGKALQTGAEQELNWASENQDRKGPVCSSF